MVPHKGTERNLGVFVNSFLSTTKIFDILDHVFLKGFFRTSKIRLELLKAPKFMRQDF